jgi:hypothetical protein
MGEAASPSAGCSEVDADVVQIEATLRISALFLAGRIRVVDLGRPAVRISHAVDEWVAEPLATSAYLVAFTCRRLAM